MRTPWLVLLGLVFAVTGKVVSFDANWVLVETKDGRKTYVPRRSITTKTQLQEDAVVTASFTSTDIGELMSTWPGRVVTRHYVKAANTKRN